ncbi:MAG: DUF4426 domain-containing protein [Xanthomonadales bacterium]
MKQLLSCLILLGILALADTSEAQQAQDFGDYVVHYNALNTNFIPPQVAKGYGIRRSSSRALLNITVLKKVMDNPGTPVKAIVTASGTNLTGQRREIDIREIKDTEGAIYYIGELPVHNLETYNFTVEVHPEGEANPLIVKFRQQFFTE